MSDRVSRWILGIDPGLSGAIAYFQINEFNKLQLVGIKDMPVMASMKGKGNVLDLFELRRLFLPVIGLVECVYLEGVTAMPGQGVSSMFKFGGVAMAPEAMAVAFEMKVKHLYPSSWKRAAGLIGKPKDASIALAKTEYPTFAEMLKRKKDEGRAEAILIGHFGHLKHGGSQ